MKNIQIAFFDAKAYDIKSFDNINKDFGYTITYFKEHLTPATVVLAKGYDVVCAFVNDEISKPVIEQLNAQGVKLIAMRCAGYNNVDLPAAFGHLHIVRVPAYSPYAVAEHAVALLMTLNRKTHKAYSRTRDNNFNINGLTGFDLHGKTVGIIGTGKIGQVMIGIMKGFGMRILAYDVFPNPKAADELGFEYTDLNTLYTEADVISLHCPLTKETHHIINKDSLSKMKKSVVLINTSRGQLVNTKDLIVALKASAIGAAGLDVYEEESEYFFEDFSGSNIEDDVLARLLTFNNVLITSHQAFLTEEALHNIAETTLQNIQQYFEKQTLVNEICYQCHANNGICQRKKTGRCF